MKTRLFILVTGLLKPHVGQGIPGLYRALIDDPPDDTELLLYRWGNVEKIVDDIVKFQPEYLCGGGHSYGVSTLLMVAKMIKGQYEFDDLLSVDGVWRDKIDSPQFKSLSREHLLDVENVKRLWAWYQRNGIIQGHRFILHDTELMLYKRVEEYSHWNIDRLQEFQNKFVELFYGNPRSK